MSVWDAYQQFQQKLGIHMNKLLPLGCLVFIQNMLSKDNLKHQKNYLYCFYYIAIDVLPNCTKLYFIWQDLQWNKMIFKERFL